MVRVGHLGWTGSPSFWTAPRAAAILESMEDKMGETVADPTTGGRGTFDPDRVQMIDIDTLVMDPANVRTHPQRNIDAIIGSLQAFGQQKPVVVDVDNVVRAGTGLVRAARLLGWREVAAYTTGLGGSEAIAYAIADNRTAELSEWDDDGLAAQVEALLAEGVQVGSLGWTEDELTDLMADDYPTPDAEPVEVAADAESARGKCPCAAMGLCVPTQPSQIGSEQG